MNTNRNNNRRRGRGNNRGPGGGNQGNRIDSRARGNAPQLLEKYRKLAHDASLNDDRVQTEYYLQFADHYFRVLADSRVQKDESRPRREFDREQPFEEDEEEGGFEEARHEQSADQRRGRPRDEAGADEAAAERSQESRRPRANGEAEEGNRERPGAPRRGRSRDELPLDEGSRGVEGEDDSGDDANPFTRDVPARARRQRTRTKVPSQRSETEEGQSSVDPAVLPPAISRSDEEAKEERPARARSTGRTRTRRTPPADAGDAEALEAVS